MKHSVRDRLTVEKAYPASAHAEYVSWLTTPEHDEHHPDMDAYPTVRLHPTEDGIALSHGYFEHIADVNAPPPILVHLDRADSYDQTVAKILNLTELFIDGL